MKELERIIQEEQGQSYIQGNRELFAYYTLILIGQEEGKRHFQRKLIAFGVLSPLLGLTALYFLHSFAQPSSEMLQSLTFVIKNNILLVYLASMLVSIMLARKLGKTG
jgi:hypothetical protein